MVDKHIIGQLVLEDLNELEGMVDKLSEDFKKAVGSYPDDKYLQLECLHVQIMSKFEYLLKSLNLITNQSQIKNIINSSTSLDQLEKDHLTYLFLIRHTIAHNGGHFDKEFLKNAKKNIKQLKLDIPIGSDSLSPVEPKILLLYIKLIKRVISDEILKT